MAGAAQLVRQVRKTNTARSLQTGPVPKTGLPLFINPESAAKAAYKAPRLSAAEPKQDPLVNMPLSASSDRDEPSAPPSAVGFPSLGPDHRHRLVEGKQRKFGKIGSFRMYRNGFSATSLNIDFSLRLHSAIEI
ncbi:hypothetical protein [Ruegeria lacuscaerulensis]|uniref:hypothetical protein n=1 Tax=Ruegeria lacuscaerulensis TaxID=55218 RepID=UPI001BE3E7FD|nr:hypothetical protein [Ruegeria lacuscaerulensis]